MQWSLIAALFSQFYYSVLGDDCYCALCDLDKLPDNCTTLYGHVQIGLESTMPPFEIVEYKLQNVTKIIGCITIANSGFTTLAVLSNLETIRYSQSGNSTTCSSYGNAITIAKNSLLRRLYFTSLKQIIVNQKAEYGIYLVDNPSLCIMEEELKKFLNTEKFYAPHIQICDPTRNYCRLDNFEFFDETNIPVGCQILTDSLVLNGTKDDNIAVFQARLDDVEQILGSIIVFESDVVSLKFPRLWRVYNYQPSLPVIFLQDNPNLSVLELSNLSSVPYFGNYRNVLYTYSNPLLTQLSLETCEALKRLGQITFDDITGSPCENHTSSVIPSQEANHTGTNSPLSAVEKNTPPNNDAKKDMSFRVIKHLCLIFIFFFFKY